MSHEQEPVRSYAGPRPSLLSTAALLLALLAAGPLSCGPRRVAEEPARATPEELGRWSQLSKSGREHMLFGRYEQAEEDFKAALELSREYRPSDVRRKSSLGNLERLARAYLRAGRPRDFARLMEQLMTDCRDVPASQTESLADGLLLLGTIRRDDGELELSREALELALAIRVRSVGERHAGAARIHRELGLTFIAAGDLDRADRELAEARDVTEELSGREHPAFTATLVAVAKLREAQQRGDQAEEELKRALEIDREAAGPVDARTSRVMTELAHFYRRNGRADEAEAVLQEMVAAQREENEEGMPYARSLNELAWFHVETGQPQKAEAAARTALEILESRRAGDPVRAAVLDTLATSLRQQGQYPESEKFYLEAIEVARLESSRGALEEIADHYTELLRQQGREAEAGELLEGLLAHTTGAEGSGQPEEAGADAERAEHRPDL